MIWVPRGIYLDETNDHVDNVACFIAPKHVLIAVCDDPADPQYALSEASLNALQEATDLNGQPLKISKMIMPPPLHMTRKLPALKSVIHCRARLVVEWQPAIFIYKCATTMG